MGCAYQRGKIWWIKYRGASGEPEYEATPARTKGEAKVFLREIEERVYRQVRGLAPLTLNPENWTVADLMTWWLESYSANGESHRRNEGTIRNHILSAPLAQKLLDHVGPGDIEALLNEKERDFSPETVNHIRGYLVRAFNRARKAQKWLGGNPGEDTDTRRVPERIASILAPEEVLPFFMALAADQRPVFATAILAGLRKGELCGLQKSDIDLARRLLYVRGSYARRFPKNRKQRVVRIPEELVPFLEYALATFPGRWLFPDDAGEMRTQSWQPEDILRRALKRAGIVTGYTHKCRRKGCGHTEEHADAGQRKCPHCSFTLWPMGNVREIRFQDTRHTYASVLLMLGANLVSVQKLLGHSDPKITERRYGHLLPEFMSAEVNRLHFGLGRLLPLGSVSQALAAAGTPRVTPELQSAPPANEGAGTPQISPSDSGPCTGGVCGARTRGLRRDRPAL
jgi:integrase